MNENIRKKICIYPHYFSENFIPLYVIIYLNELKNYFDEIHLVTNAREIKNISQLNISNLSIQFVKNEGYDFGMFFKAFQKLNLDEYKQIACINDSNIIFNSLEFLFDWGNAQEVDFWGLVDSFQKPKYSTHKNNYHIQSHFIVFNRTAFKHLQDYFTTINFKEFIDEKNTSLLKKKVIDKWEIGVTQFLIHRKLTCKAFIDSKLYSKEYKKMKSVNVPTKLYFITIAQGVPVLKKRIITSTDFRHILRYKNNWRKLIRRYGNKNFEIEKMIEELYLIRMIHIKNKFLRILKI